MVKSNQTICYPHFFLSFFLFIYLFIFGNHPHFLYTERCYIKEEIPDYNFHYSMNIISIKASLNLYKVEYPKDL